MLLGMDNLANLSTNISMLGLSTSASGMPSGGGSLPGLGPDASWLPSIGVVDQAT